MKAKYKKILEHFKKCDPKIYAYMQKVDFEGWFKEPLISKSHDLFLALCREIVGQQLSGKAASTIYARFKKLYRASITPEKILKTSDQNLRDAGLSWQKVKYIKDLATKVKNKEIHLEKLSKLSDHEVTAELIKVKGIGNWTTEMFLMFVLRRENVFSFGDLGLKKGLEKVYKLKDPDIKHTEKITSKWEPYKTYGSIALWQSLEEK